MPLASESAALSTALAVTLVVLVILSFARRSIPLCEGYGAANEPHAGLNRAMTLDEAPGHGWPGFYLSGYRADSASAISHMMLRD